MVPPMAFPPAAPRDGGDGAPRLDALLGRLAPRTLSLLLFLVCVAVYASNGKTLNMGDSVPARLIPVALLLDGTPMLDRFATVLAAGTPRAYYVRQTPHGLVSFYPIATGLLATPIVAPAVLWLEWTESPDPARWVSATRTLEKAAATVLVAGAVVVFHRLCLAVGATATLAMLLTLTFAFGSQAYSTSSQALWQHGPGCLTIVAALWCLVRAARTGRGALLAGFSALAALAVAIRPNNLLVVAPFALLALWWMPRRWGAIVLPALVGGALLVAYNVVLFGTPSGGYGTAAALTYDFARALPGLLVSPGRGLFVYFPASVVLLVLLVLEPRAFANAFAAACLVAVVATVLLDRGVAELVGWLQLRAAHPERDAAPDPAAAGARRRRVPVADAAACLRDRARAAAADRGGDPGDRHLRAARPGAGGGRVERVAGVDRPRPRAQLGSGRQPDRARPPRLRLSGRREVLDRHRLDRLGEREAEDAREEVELRLERAHDVLGLAEAVLLARKGDVGDRQLLRPQHGHHRFGLVRRHHAVVETLEEDHRAGEPLGVVQRRARAVERRRLPDTGRPASRCSATRTCACRRRAPPGRRCRSGSRRRRRRRGRPARRASCSRPRCRR